MKIKEKVLKEVWSKKQLKEPMRFLAKEPQKEREKLFEYLGKTIDLTLKKTKEYFTNFGEG